MIFLLFFYYPKAKAKVKAKTMSNDLFEQVLAFKVQQHSLLTKNKKPGNAGTTLETNMVTICSKNKEKQVDIHISKYA